MSSTEQEHALALLSEFTLFPSLAPELRLKIFKHALPSSPIRHRLLRVTAEYSTEKPLFKNEGFLKFRLLDNLHSASVKDIAFLSACTESRDVFLSRFKLYLHAGNGGLIRYAEEDVVYIGKSPSITDLPPQFSEVANACTTKQSTSTNLLSKVRFWNRPVRTFS
jgi:hypothetical protein